MNAQLMEDLETAIKKGLTLSFTRQGLGYHLHYTADGKFEIMQGMRGKGRKFLKFDKAYDHLLNGEGEVKEKKGRKK
jgi:hypothetical protein